MPTTTEPIRAKRRPVVVSAGSGRGEGGLEAIREKVLAGERLTLDEGEVLYRTPDLWGVLELADLVRRRLHGDVAYYNINRHLNYSNVCALSCKFCEFYRKKGQDGAYTRDMEYVAAETRKAVENGATEIHSVGGLHPYLPFDYYVDLVRTMRETADGSTGFQPVGATEDKAELGPAGSRSHQDRPAGSRCYPERGRLHIKAFTAVEVVHLAKIAKVYKRSDPKAGIRWVLERLKEAGLGSIPGGGAEVFDDRVHDEAFKGKIRSDVWLDVHRVAHELGLNSNATMLYGHIEDRRERLVHMDMLRRAQDEALARIEASKRASEKAIKGENAAATDTSPWLAGSLDRSLASAGFFQTIIPLPFFPDGSELEHLAGPSGLENLRTIAIARLMLDNFPHVKAFWIMQTLPMAQLMLQAGADDIDGTVVWYDITKIPTGVGGSSTHQETTVNDLKRGIREAGFVPVERDTLYRRVHRDGERWWVGV